MAYWARTEFSYVAAWNAYVPEIAILDVNGDGFLDFVAANFVSPGDGSGTPIRVMLGDGAGGFVDGTETVLGLTPPETVHTREVVVDDFNGDGRQDVFVADHGWDTDPYPGAPNVLLLSSGATGFVDASDRLPGFSDFTHSATTGDIDGDGDVDILANNLNGGDTRLYFLVNDGDANFTVAPDRLPPREAGTELLASHFFTSCLLFDADGDGDNDLYMGQAFNRHASVVLFNDGTGDFSKSTPVETPLGPFGLDGQSLDAQALDLDLDGDLDLLVDLNFWDQAHALQFLINDGTGHFADETASRIPALSMEENWAVGFVNFADLNGDGAQDIVCAQGQRPLYLNDGAGYFFHLPESFLNYGDANRPKDISTYAFDANNDGRTDLLADLEHNGLTEDFWIYTQQDPGAAQTGSSDADGLLGDASSESLSGLGGDDILFGAQGNDTASGGGGTDTIIGGLGDDELSGGGHADFLAGGAGNDTIDGGSGTDIASYRDAVSRVVVSLVKVGRQDTRGGGKDVLMGIEGLIGSAHDDTLTGADGDNRLEGGTGKDRLTGGDGDDTLQGGAGADKMIGGAGLDWVSYADAHTGVSVNLAKTKVQTVAAGEQDLIRAVENALGSAFADSLVGTSGVNRLSGGAGADILQGGKDNDVINGGDGVDAVSFADATASITLTFKTSTLTVAGLGTDTLVSIEGVIGSRFGDALTGSNAGNLLGGGEGNDSLDGGKGDDTLRGGRGDDRLKGGSGFDVAEFSDAAKKVSVDLSQTTAQDTDGAGVDTISAVEGLVGSAFDDTLKGNGDLNLLQGGAGNDTLIGVAGGDTLDGGDGFDIVSFETSDVGIYVQMRNLDFDNGGYVLRFNIEGVIGSVWGDNLHGDSYGNSIDGGAESDNIVGHGGQDTLIGGGGHDRFYYEAWTDSQADSADLILDLGLDGDEIQLQDIDANSLIDGDQAFALITGAFSGAGGELRLRFVAGIKTTYLEGDIDGDGQADLVVVLAGDQRAFDTFIL